MNYSLFGEGRLLPPAGGATTRLGAQSRPFEILLVEDNPGDVRLTSEGLQAGSFPYHLSVARDGLEAMAFLKQEGRWGGAPRPDLILLDLNLPRKNGREVLTTIKADDDLRRIPVVVLTTSAQDAEVSRSYTLGANCYVTKPLDFDSYVEMVKAIEDFWFEVAQLPRG